jgi:hypothetical protein
MSMHAGPTSEGEYEEYEEDGHGSHLGLLQVGEDHGLELVEEQEQTPERHLIDAPRHRQRHRQSEAGPTQGSGD